MPEPQLLPIMLSRHTAHVVLRGLGLLVLCFAPAMAAPEVGNDAWTGRFPHTVEEARGRARLLHETVHGVLQVVHRDFFDPDERDSIPSDTLEEVFEVVEEYHGVNLRWLGVNAKTMDVEHEPKDQFERDAVKALASGDEAFERLERGRYRYAGAIQLHNQCLKCHVPNRTSLEDRTAGLVISMEVKSGDERKK